ncbi:MAG: LPS export ABC transporter periplasmic protein LptC, partial [Pseudomonadota bacterium]
MIKVGHPDPQPRSRHAKRQPVVTGDPVAQRHTAFKRARRNTRVVRLARRLTPVAAVALVLAYVLSAFSNYDFVGGLPALQIPEITTQDLTMRNPRYSGFTGDGGRYEVRAETAKQDFSGTNTIELTGIAGTLTDARDVVTTLAADTGAFQTTAGVLTLADNITIRASNGMAADLREARIETKTGVITSQQPVRVQMNANRIDALTMQVRQNERAAVFDGDVVALLQPPPADEKSNIAQRAPEKRDDRSTPDPALGDLMAADRGPTLVTSKTLTVDDMTGLARFSDNVVAAQQGTKIISQRMDINYDGAASHGDAPQRVGQSASQATAKRGDSARPRSKVDTPLGFGAGGNVKSIVIPGALRIERDDGQTVSAERGQFDMRSETAQLFGNVQIKSANGQTATASRAQFNATTDNARLMDNVVIRTAAGQTAKAKVAVFNTRTQIAQLSGGITLTGQAQQSAKARQASFNQSTGAARLEGDVEIVQGPNRLSGGRLTLNQQTGRTRLTTPRGLGATPGRITAILRTPTNSRNRGTRTTSQTQQARGGGLTAFRTDPNAPVTIKATQLDVDDKRKSAVFSNKVIAQQGSFTLQTAKLIAKYSGGGALGSPGSLGMFSANETAASKPEPDRKSASGRQGQATRVDTIRADGSVVVSSANGQKATGDWALFDLAKNVVTVGGDVRLSQGKTIVRGTQLAIDMTSGKARITTAAAKPAGGWAVSTSSSTPGAASGGQRSRAAGRAATGRPAEIKRGNRPSLT